MGILYKVLLFAESGDHYLEPTCRTLRAFIELARGNLVSAAEGSERALARAQRTKDPQLLAPVLALRASVLFAQKRQQEAWSLAQAVLVLGAIPIVTLLELFPASTPIEFAWLIRNLKRQTELLAALESAPPTPWVEGARAIANGELLEALEIVTQLKLPLVEAYTRLQTALALGESGSHTKASELVAPALEFFRSVDATRLLAQAEKLVAA
jgi:hypothetical protein